MSRAPSRLRASLILAALPLALLGLPGAATAAGALAFFAIVYAIAVSDPNY